MILYTYTYSIRCIHSTTYPRFILTVMWGPDRHAEENTHQTRGDKLTQTRLNPGMSVANNDAKKKTTIDALSD